MLNKVRPKRSEHLTRPDSADGPSRELGEAKDRNYREDGSQGPDKDRTEDCSPDSDAHVEGEVRQHCAHDVASHAVEQQWYWFQEDVLCVLLSGFWTAEASDGQSDRYC
jgi:hypothetical protein